MGCRGSRVQIPAPRLSRGEALWHRPPGQGCFAPTRSPPMRILITGAAGNLGGSLARDLASGHHALRLMVHHKALAPDLQREPSVEIVHADLALPETLPPAVAEGDA